MSDFVTRAELVAALEAAGSPEAYRKSNSYNRFQFVADRLRQPANPLDDEVSNLRHSLGFAEGTLALVEKERDALRAKLAEMASREPNEYEAMRIVDLVRAEYIVTGALKAWRYVRNALLATEATAQPAEPVDLSKVRVGGVWTCEVCGKTLPAEMAGMRCKHEPAPTPAPAEASGDVEWWGRWIQQRSGAAMLSDDDCDEFARDLRAEVARRESALHAQIDAATGREKGFRWELDNATERAIAAEARVRELEAEIARIREREDAYNDSFESRTGGRMLDEVLESEEKAWHWVDRICSAVDELRASSDLKVEGNARAPYLKVVAVALAAPRERARRAQADQ